MDERIDLVRAKKPARLPVVLTKDEVSTLLRQLSGDYALLSKRLYGSGLRLMECIRLRVKGLTQFCFNLMSQGYRYGDTFAAVRTDDSLLCRDEILSSSNVGRRKRTWWLLRAAQRSASAARVERSGAPVGCMQCWATP